MFGGAGTDFGGGGASGVVFDGLTFRGEKISGLNAHKPSVYNYYVIVTTQGISYHDTLFTFCFIQNIARLSNAGSS